MPRLLIPMLVALVLAGLTSGCADRFTERTLIPPQGEGSSACLDNCNLQMEECRSRQLTREDGCERQRALMETDYQACLEGGGSGCQAPETCLGADFSVCDQGYEMCFTQCGGRVETGWRSRPWDAPATDSTPGAAGSDPSVPADAAPRGLDGPEHAQG